MDLFKNQLRNVSYCLLTITMATFFGDYVKYDVTEEFRPQEEVALTL